MELRHLRYFYEVANEMNFTRAAENLSIAQPPLSRQIKDLEEELGVTLFDRRPHYLALTPEGELLKQYAVQILGLAGKAAESVREMGQGVNGLISVAIVEGSPLGLISKAIDTFSSRYPAVQYNVWTGSADEIISRVRNGLCDIAIIQDLRDSEGLKTVNLYKESWTAIIPKDNPLALAEGDSVNANELLPYYLIIPGRTGRLEEISSWFRNSTEKPKIRCRANTCQVYFELVKHSVGIGIFPGAAGNITYYGRNKDDVVLKRLVRPRESTFSMIYDRYRSLPNVVSEFIECVRKENRLRAV